MTELAVALGGIERARALSAELPQIRLSDSEREGLGAAVGLRQAGPAATGPTAT